MATVFAKQLDCDVSARVGITESLKEEAKDLMEQGGIKKSVYDKLLRLELDEFKKKDEENEEDSKKVTYTESGVVIDPKKKNMGA